MLIGDVAREADVTAATIRYYEQIGLLTKPLRSEGGYRRYAETTVEALRFIQKGQGLGFSLDEIREILELSRSGEAPCSRVLDLARKNLDAAEERIQQLHVFRDRLAAQIARWTGRPMPSCSANGLCEIINSAQLPARPIRRTTRQRTPAATRPTKVHKSTKRR